MVLSGSDLLFLNPCHNKSCRQEFAQQVPAIRLPFVLRTVTLCSEELNALIVEESALADIRPFWLEKNDALFAKGFYRIPVFLQNIQNPAKGLEGKSSDMVRLSIT